MNKCMWIIVLEYTSKSQNPAFSSGPPLDTPLQEPVPIILIVQKYCGKIDVSFVLKPPVSLRQMLYSSNWEYHRKQVSFANWDSL